MNKKNYIIILILTVFSIQFALAQQSSDTLGVTKVSRDLSISRSKAIALKKAMKINEGEIRSIQNNHRMDVHERQNRLKQLRAVRDSSVNALLSDSEKQKFRASVGTMVAKQRKERGNND